LENAEAAMAAAVANFELSREKVSCIHLVVRSKRLPLLELPPCQTVQSDAPHNPQMDKTPARYGAHRHRARRW